MADGIQSADPQHQSTYYHNQDDLRRRRSTAPRSRSIEDNDSPLDTKKTLLVIVIVVGCFAVLFQKVFYSAKPIDPQEHHTNKQPFRLRNNEKASACCDVISEMDLNTIKIMSELCTTIIDSDHTSTPTKQSPINNNDIIIKCRKKVLETCGIDISAAIKQLKEQHHISFDSTVKHMLEEVRSLNGSLCLKYNFGIAPWRLGVPHYTLSSTNLNPINNIRQERPAHLRPDIIHPAFQERGRAIPAMQRGLDLPSPRPSEAGHSRSPRRIDGHPGPIPGLRPTIGGPGRVVPAKQSSNYGLLGVLMPIYTIGFIIFFIYVVMKFVFKRRLDPYTESTLYPSVDTDEEFQREVFEGQERFNRPNKDTSKIGWEEHEAKDIAINQLQQRLRETELAMERIVQQMAKAPLVLQQDEIKSNGNLIKTEPVSKINEEDEDESILNKNRQINDEKGVLLTEEEQEDPQQGCVTVLGMETRASNENGTKWSPRSESPVIPSAAPSLAAVVKEPQPIPQQIFLEGALPPQSQILVADSAIQEFERTASENRHLLSAGNRDDDNDDDDGSPSVVLAGKMTLSVISLDSENGIEKDKTENDDNGNGGDGDHNTNDGDAEIETNSSSNISEEYEKINTIELEEQIGDIIEEAKTIVELNSNNENSNETDKNEESKQQLKLTDDLSKAISEQVDGPKKTEDLIDGILNKEIEEQLSVEIDSTFLDNRETDQKGQLEMDKPDNNVLSTEEIELIAKYQDQETGIVNDSNNGNIEKQVLNTSDEVLIAKAELGVQNEEINKTATVATKPEEIEEQNIVDEYNKLTESLIAEGDVRDNLLDLQNDDNNQEKLIKIASEEDKTEKRDSSKETEEKESKTDEKRREEVEEHNEEISKENKNDQEQITAENAATDKKEDEAQKLILDDELDIEDEVIEDIEFEDEVDANEDEGNETDEAELADLQHQLDEYNDDESSEEDEEEILHNGLMQSVNDDEDDDETPSPSDDELVEDEQLDSDEEDLEIDEVIEYVENTDDEGEEIIEINGNEDNHHMTENGDI